jgi:hypothetical protein
MAEPSWRRVLAGMTDAALSQEQRAEIRTRQRNVCFSCGEPISDSGVIYGHLVPRSKGGEHGLHNRIALHVRCEAGRNDTDPTPEELFLQFVFTTAVSRLAEEYRSREERIAELFIMGDPSQSLTMGILSRGKSVLEEKLEGARAAVVLMDELVHPREAVAPISLYIRDHPDPYELVDLEVNIRSSQPIDPVRLHGPMGIQFTAPNDQLEKSNRHERRKRERMKRR